jgi:hypothetical protein
VKDNNLAELHVYTDNVRYLLIQMAYKISRIMTQKDVA